MVMLSLLIVLAIVWLIGKLLVRRLGWPTDVMTAGRWGLVLLGFAILFSTMPELVRTGVAQLGSTRPPSVDLVDVVPAVLVVALAVLGYVGWTRGAVERERRRDLDVRARMLPRAPAEPPAPRPGALIGRGAPVFRPVVHPETEEEEGPNG